MKHMKSVLIIDDSPEARHAMKLYLEDEGFHVLQAANAAAAFSLCDRQRVDLIILNMHVLDALTQLRGRRSSVHVPIICTSEHPAIDGLLTVEPTLIFLQTPFTKEQLMPLVRVCFTPTT